LRRRYTFLGTYYNGFSTGSDYAGGNDIDGGLPGGSGYTNTTNCN